MSHEKEKIVIEFYGLARFRAGQSSKEYSTDAAGTTWAHLADQLQLHFPDLGRRDVDSITSHYRLNLNGQRFFEDPDTRIFGGERVLIMSPDAGG